MDGVLVFICAIVIVTFCILMKIHVSRKRKCLLRLTNMSESEKNEKIDEIAGTFGYQYVPEWDVFTSRRDAWQKQFGYGSVYDKASPYAGMVFETLPVYFDYAGKTWLIQIWKGQYGICTGCEVGVYHAKHIVEEKEWKNTIFHAVDEQEMPLISTVLRREGRVVAALRENHWWLTTFEPGTVSNPSQLDLKISIRFADVEMRNAFYRALLKQGIDSKEVLTCFTTIQFHYPNCYGYLSRWKYVQTTLAQWLNRLSCKVFRVTTRCCGSCRDRLLFLSFYLPCAARHLMKLRHTQGQRR